MTLRRFFLVRLGWALLGLWLAVTAAFLTFSFAEVDVPGRGAEERARIRDQLYLDEPIHERYGHFLRRLVTDQSTGRALSGRDSGEIALEAIPATASLVVPGLILALLLAWAVALLWVRAGPRKRLLWRFPGYVAIGSLPFWAGLWLSYYLGAEWGWLPIGGYCDFFDPPQDGCAGGAAEWTKHLVLPWIIFGLFFAAIYARVFRVLMRDVRLAEAESRPRLARRARLVAARIIGRDVGFAVGAAVLVETAFGIPGLGRLVVLGTDHDLRIGEAALLYAAFLAIAFHFLADVVVGALDSELRSDWPFARLPGRA